NSTRSSSRSARLAPMSLSARLRASSTVLPLASAWSICGPQFSIKVRSLAVRARPWRCSGARLLSPRNSRGLLRCSNLHEWSDLERREAIGGDVEPDTDDGVDHPVQADAAREAQREEREHERHHIS